MGIVCALCATIIIEKNVFILIHPIICNKSFFEYVYVTAQKINERLMEKILIFTTVKNFGTIDYFACISEQIIRF